LQMYLASMEGAILSGKLAAKEIARTAATAGPDRMAQSFAGPTDFSA
jgi:uncharacterized protein with NAD-binding domain and iron-sulfur cluster